MGLPRRRRKQRNRFLDNLGGLSPGTLGMFGVAVLLLLASAGIIAITVARRGSATTADAVPTAEPTAFVAIVETPFPTPITATVAPTPRASATPRLAASPATSVVARTTTASVSAGPVGSGQSKAARGVAGSMAVTLGGSLPPAQVAAAPSGGPANPIVGTNPTPTPLPTTVPLPTPTPTRPPVSTGGGSTGGGSTGGGNTGGGSTGGGNTIPPTPTPRPPTATPTTALPTATITPTPRPTLPPLPPVAFPGPGSATHSYALTYNQTTNLANVPSSDYAYIVLWSAFSKERVDGIKGALGLTSPVEATGDGYKVIDAAKGSLIVNNTLGSLRFTVPGQAGGPNVVALETPTLPVATTTLPLATTTPGPSSSAKPSASAAPSASATATQSARPSAPSSAAPGAGTPTATPQVNDAAAIKRATDWLGQTGLLPDGIDAGRVTRPTPALIIVTFHPTQPGASVLGDPAITVALGSDGAVREVNYRWPNSLNPRLATLRGATAAWADVAAGKGYLEVDQTIPANLAPNTVFKGTATVTKASIGWRLASADGTNYLVPVYVFEGMVVLDNPATTPGAAVPFRVYVQAAP